MNGGVCQKRAAQCALKLQGEQPGGEKVGEIFKYGGEGHSMGERSRTVDLEAVNINKKPRCKIRAPLLRLFMKLNGKNAPSVYEACCPA